MYLQLIVSSVLINFISAGEHHTPNDGRENNALEGSNGRTNTGRIKSTGYQLWNQHYWKPHNGTPYNVTYIDRAENLIKLPAINYEEKIMKRKALKKSPRRTIQKIIKKAGKSKIKKVNVVQMTSSHPTMMPNFDFDNDQDEDSARKSEMTTRPNQQKKIKKYGVRQVKLPRYPMPYRQMQTRKNKYKRPKRETRDILIFKDFDSMQFLKEKEDKDYNVVRAHFKNHW